MARDYSPQALHSAGRGEPLELAAHGFFWTGGQLVDHPQAGKAMRGQQYNEFWIPRDLRHALPIVMIHGGGGQGNHLGGAYGSALHKGLGGRYRSGALAQEKTGEGWVDAQLYGGHTRGDFEHSEVAVFIGKNPWMSQSFPRARVVLREIVKGVARPQLVWLFERFAKACEELRESPAPRLVVEVALLDMATTEPMVGVGAVVRRLEELEKRLRSAPAAAATPPSAKATATAPPPPPAAPASAGGSRNASSSETGSTTGAASASTPITCSDTAPYSAPRGGSTTAWGHSRRACPIGIADRAPNTRAW